jgi:hypothetical protein
MPIIVYKSLDLNLIYAQAFRILCERCSVPFTYVFGERQSYTVNGIPVLSSSDAMRKSAVKKAFDSLARIAKRKNRGRALCPHCKCYQRSMVRKAQQTTVSLCGMGGLLLGAVGALALLFNTTAGGWLAWAVLAGGVVAGLMAGRSLAIKTGPHPQREDKNAMRDEEIQGWLATCAANRSDPVLSWYLVLGKQPLKGEALVSLGVTDLSGRPHVFPPELETDSVLQRLRA